MKEGCRMDQYYAYFVERVRAIDRVHAIDMVDRTDLLVPSTAIVHGQMVGAEFAIGGFS